MVRHVLLLCALLALAAARPGGLLRVLFIGNSHTYVNDVPGSVRELAQSAGYEIQTSTSVAAGYSLHDHTQRQETLDSINAGNWDIVVLQEQSQIPTIPWWRDSSMYPSARFLDSMIRGVGAVPAFYVTWGWRDGGVMVYNGDSSQPFVDYFEMQDTVTAAYDRIAREIGAGWVPAGPAFALARTYDPYVPLWQSDACHATPVGSYLAACVFFSHFYNRPATGLYVAPLVSDSQAVMCWNIAWEAVSGVSESPGAPRSRQNAGATVTVSPNPCRPGQTVRISSDLPMPAMWRLVDASGRTVADCRMDAGGSSFVVPLVPAGLCFLVPGGSGSRRARLVITR